MSREVSMAAVQMDANPAPLGVRLLRAGRLVEAARTAGAQLVVLPELFNTGYAYQDANFSLAEHMDGPTVRWMKSQAQHLGIHLAGSLMLLDRREVYNALLLVAPDGRMWRYDKRYPWGWERAYFRPAREGRKNLAVAQTDLGDIGMLICWDTAHPELWRQYAGRVDLMLIASCPPDVSNPTYHLPANRHRAAAQLTFDDLGPLFRNMKGTGGSVFGEMLNQQTAWLGVPAVSTVGCGHVRTAIPNPRLSWLALTLLAPHLVKYLPQAGEASMACDMLNGCKVVDAQGQVLGERKQSDGEGLIVATVTLAGERPQPQGEQPGSTISGLAYLPADVVLPLVVRSTYQRGLRQAWGSGMAPRRISNRTCFTLTGLALAGSFLVGRQVMRWLQRKKPGKG